MAALIVAGGPLLFVVLVIARAVRIVPQARAGIVERLGRYNRTLEPGLHFLIPFMDKLRGRSSTCGSRSSPSSRSR